MEAANRPWRVYVLNTGGMRTAAVMSVMNPAVFFRSTIMTPATALLAQAPLECQNREQGL